MLRLLSMDGGGSRGIFHLYFLNELEKALGCTIRNRFHYIGGTSVGGIAALTITHPIIQSKKNLDFTVEELLQENHDKKIAAAVFGKPRHWLSPPRLGVFGSKYGDRVKHINKYYNNELFGNINFGCENSARTMVFSYSLTRSQAKVFKSWRPANQDIPVSLIAKATSAAPVFFPSVKCKNEILIDGGIAANDPSYLVLYEARKEIGNLSEPAILVSLGTGFRSGTDYKSCYKAGFLGWAAKFLNICMESQERIVRYLHGHDHNCHCGYCGLNNHYHEFLGPNKDIYADYHFWNNVHYFRFAPITPSKLDFIDPEFLNGLKTQAQTFFSCDSMILNKLIGFLSHNSQKSKIK